MLNEGETRYRECQENHEKKKRPVFQPLARCDLDPHQQPIGEYVQDNCDEREIDDAHGQALCDGKTLMALP
jgi:hypothetical protein